MTFNYLISYPTFVGKIRELGAPKWLDPETSLGWYDYYVYLQLNPGTDPKQFESKLPAFCDRYMNSKKGLAQNSRQDLHITSLKDIHLTSHLNQEPGVNGDGKSVSFLFLVGFLIIAIAWINYANLATARSLERAKEVGVRKVMGALRHDLVGQFLTESLLLNLVAIIIALGLAILAYRAIQQLNWKHIGQWFSFTCTVLDWIRLLVFGRCIFIRCLSCLCFIRLSSHCCIKRNIQNFGKGDTGKKRIDRWAVCDIYYIDRRYGYYLPTGKFYAKPGAWRRY